jgi:rSAM/selenodomain-associated transferase 2
MISVIIPTYNEEKALPATLEHLLRQAGEYEVIVVDGGSSDRTCQIVRAEPRVRLLTASKGRASQMNTGACIARGEWLLFLHADTFLPEGALRRLNALEADTACQAGGFRHRFSGDDWRLRLISWMDNLRAKITCIIYGDQAMFVRRSLFQQLGGFPQQPFLEDIAFGEKLKRVTKPVGIWRSLARCAVILLCHGLRLPIAARAFFADIR